MQGIYNASILNLQPLELIDQSIGKRVQVLTNSGIEFHGTLMGIDATANCVLSEADETNTKKQDGSVRHHNMVLVNGATISIIIPFIEPNQGEELNNEK